MDDFGVSYQNERTAVQVPQSSTDHIYSRLLRVIGILVVIGLIVVIFATWFGRAETAPAHRITYGPECATQAPSVALHFAIHPKYDPAKTVRLYQFLCEYFAEQPGGAGLNIQVETSLDYADFERKFRAQGPELLLPNPWQALEAMKVGYSVLAMAGEPEDFRGLILVRRDGPVENVADLKGRSLAYPSPTALAACIMPQMFLQDQGLAVMQDLTHHYVGSQDSAILSVVGGQTAAGVTWPPPWRIFQMDHPEEAAQLRVLAETPPLVNNAVMVRNDVCPEVREQLRRMLLGLGESETGCAVLKNIQTSSFRAATDEDYAGVREFIARFEREVRPVEAR